MEAAVVSNFAGILAAVNEHADQDFATQFPGILLLYPNAPADLNQPGPLWAELDVVFTVAKMPFINRQATRQHGYVEVIGKAQEGTGQLGVARILDWAAGRFGFISLGIGTGNIEFNEPEGFNPSAPKGWYTRGVRIPFSITTLN